MSWQKSPEQAGMVGGRELLSDFWPSVREQTSWAGEEGREGGKVQDVLSPTSCGVEEPGKAALHTRLPKLALEALKEHGFVVV